MSRACHLLRGLAVASLFCAGAAHGEEAMLASASWNTALDFDLERNAGAAPGPSLHHLAPPMRGRDARPTHFFESENLGKELKRLRPYWSHKLEDGGPVIEFGALGAGRKRTPKLAHVALGWEF